jgi:steroid 5-alpha reductase family enzyme
MGDWSHIFSMIGSGFVTTVLAMSLFWAIAQRIGNAGIVDVVWGFAFAPLAVLYAYLSAVNHWGFGLRTAIILFMVVVWSMRLGWFLLLRFRRLWPEEDGRYTQYKKEWGKNAAIGLFLAYQLQAVLLASLTLPYAVVMANDARGLGIFELLGVLIWLVAVVGEALADSQLENFKKDPANKGKVCQIGLWNYSRHPNYFFEWLIWISFFIFSLDSAGGIFTVYCPVVMYVFLTRVTGIKATEEQSLRTRGDAYRIYQKTTSAFVPWFKDRVN